MPGLSLGLGLGLSSPSKGGGGLPTLPFDPVVAGMGDSNMGTQGDDASNNILAAAWPGDAKVLVSDQTLSGAFAAYAVGSTLTPAVGRTGLFYSANKNNAGPEIGFIPKFRDAYENDLRLINLSAPGSYMGRGVTQGTCAGYVTGNVFTLTSAANTMPAAGTLITGAGIPAGTALASFGTGGNTRYVYKIGVSGFGLSFTAGSSGAPVTITKHGYSYSLAEGTLYNGSDASLTNGYRARILNACAALVTAGKTPRLLTLFLPLMTNDMADTTAASFAQAAATDLIARIKTDFAAYLAPGFKIILVRVKAGAPGSAIVRAAQQAIADSDPDAFLLDTDGAAFSLIDGTHYTCPTTPRTYTGRAAIGAGVYDIWSGASAGI